MNPTDCLTCESTIGQPWSTTENSTKRAVLPNMAAVQVVKRLSFGDMSLHLPEHLQTQQVLHALNEPSAENFKRYFSAPTDAVHQLEHKIEDITTMQGAGKAGHSWA